MSKRILLIFGTRPEAIKMIPVAQRLIEFRELFETRICITAQHRDLLDQVLSWFKIVPDYDLNLMKAGQNLYDITSNVLHGVGNVCREWRPDCVLVHGDTTTSFAAALSAFYQNIKVAHVEAGLRTHNIYSPFPEELNRQLVSRIANIHFSPTDANAENLRIEGVSDANIVITGNTVIDALLKTQSRVAKMSPKEFGDIWGSASNVLMDGTNFGLITAHRRESFGLGFENICAAISGLSSAYPGFHWLFPVHPNPNVRDVVTRSLAACKNVHLVDPLAYPAFVYAMNCASVILTDSGGVQEEAPSLGKPVLVMRTVTERQEAATLGLIKMVGTDTATIISAVTSLIESNFAWPVGKNPYGDGNASQRIVDYLKNKL